MSLVSCRKFTELSSISMEKRLSLVEWFQYRFHFCLCFTCRRFERQIAKIQEVLSLAVKNECGIDSAKGNGSAGLSSEAKERMKNCFHSHQE